MTLDSFVNYIDSFLSDFFGFAIPDINVIDVVEIIIIAIFSYEVLKWVKNTRAWILLRGLVSIAAFFLLASIFQMKTILWLGEKLISVAFVAIVVVFQPELRNALEHLGRNNLLTRFLPNVLRKSGDLRFSDKTRNDLVSACFDMGEVKTGALIVIEKEVGLGEYIRTGITLDAMVSRQLIVNTFEKNTPLHDGAIIIRGDRIVAATCYLPLSGNVNINKNLGTRHRAGLGISEVSDSVTIIVSEETGRVSVAVDGKLIPKVSESELNEILLSLQKAEIIEEGGKTDEEN